MAIRANVKHNGTLINSAYIKANRIFTNKNIAHVEVFLQINPDDPAFAVSMHEFHPKLDVKEGNIFEQAYEFLKRLPDFKNAIDC